MGSQSLPWASQEKVNKLGKPHRRETFFCAQSVLRCSQGQMTWRNMREPTTFMRGHTQERSHSSAPNVTIASLHQMTERIIKVLLQVEKLGVHKVWHELLWIRWIDETWEKQCRKCDKRASQSLVTWRNTRESPTGIVLWEDSHGRESIQVHQMWQ